MVNIDIEYSDKEMLNDDEDMGSGISIPRYKISSYGADFNVKDLVGRLDEQEIYVPDFQRNYVWKEKQASEFIESILLGLPIPGIILALDDDTDPETGGRFYVVDGLQRLTTLHSFLTGKFPSGAEFRLKGLEAAEFNNKRFVDLPTVDQRSIRNYFIHATIIRQEKPDKDKTGIYFVFKRLNTGGSPLTSQEIRSAIFPGKFADVLYHLNDFSIWQTIYPYRAKRLRKTDVELILRFLALYYDHERYEKPMDGFLNHFMRENQNLERFSENDLTLTFTQTLMTLHQGVGEFLFRLPQKGAQFNNAIFDAVMVGVAKRLTQGEITDLASLAKAYQVLIANSEFQAYVDRSTADTDKVKKRVEMAIMAFTGIA